MTITQQTSTVQHEGYAVEHGARATTLYPTCSCGWSGKPTRSMATVSQRIAAHKAALA